MTFTVKIALQPFEVAFEAGSIAEAVAILQEPDNELSKLAALATGAVTETDETPVAETAEPAPAKRTRKPRNQPDPATAVAPPPLAVPVDTSPVTTLVAPVATLTAPVAVAPAPVAPPPPPPPAPVAPAAPPVGMLAPKVVAELHRRGDNAADGGAALVAWLAAAGMCVSDATFGEACDCVNLLDDVKLGPVAAGLGVA